MPTFSADDGVGEVLVSFVLPARDEAGYIEEALASVAAQTLRGRVEAVVAENGSRDDTAERVRRFAAGARVPVRLLQDDAVGPARARNRGASVARGEFLVFLDADSKAAPDLAERVLARGRSGAAVGCIRMTADSTDLFDRAFFAMIEFGKRLFGVRANLFYCSREVFMAAGGMREEIRLGEDVEFLQRIRGSGRQVIYLGESSIATSARRLHSAPMRLGAARMLARWALANRGFGRQWRY